MANNEYVNRVDYGNDPLIDISDTTAEAGDVIEGKKVYLRSGAPATGTLGDATLSTHGLMSATDKVKLDGIESGATPTVVLEYDVSTWTDFLAAYNKNNVIFCKIPTGSSYRMAFLAFFDNTNHNVEFQYYKSWNEKDGNNYDEVFIYKLDNKNTWTMTTRVIHEQKVLATTSVNGLLSSTDKAKLNKLHVSSSNNNLLLHGDIYVNCDNNDLNGLKLATETYVNTAITNASMASGGGVSTPVTGATANADGVMGLVPAPLAGDQDKFLAGDGTFKSGGLPMVILSYGNSTWQDFINAYNNNVIVYCRASSNANPASGSQTRMAFMAYVNANPPTNVEFLYYRSVSSHTNTQMSDQVFIYKLDKTSGWSVTTREAGLKQLKVANNSNMSISYSSNTATINGIALPAVTSADNGKILQVVNGVWTAVTPS